MALVYAKKYGVIVVGAGHAGCEAALACCRRGIETLLLTSNIDNIAHMSCNPAIGGLGKGHLVREIDAIGGEMAKNTDETGIQFRRLNTQKGTAVQGTRAQTDKYLYKSRMRFLLEGMSCLHIKQGTVKTVLVRSAKVIGVELETDEVFLCEAVIITTGTFLRGLCHVGMKNFSGGRAGDHAAQGLSRSLAQDCGLKLLRLKTGTVPRLDRKTINFKGLQQQWGDDPLPLFSFSKTQIRQKQVSCYITYTNSKTHEHILNGLDKSPLFQGVIQGTGPRYCPSIEDKVVRFRDKDRHQIFLEPEGLQTHEIYANGLSTSLPYETQISFLRTIPGLENVEVTRPGYAVEYDASNPVQLKKNYETKNIVGLFLAGQINGTSGYEEAAGQGLMAGINAGQFVLGETPVIISRDQGYIGVMTDDLMAKGIGGEPYRLFTSRAEYRLSLREDNAEMRLRKIGYDLGLVSRDDYEIFLNKMGNLEKLKSQSDKIRLRPSAHDFLSDIAPESCVATDSSVSLRQLLKWPRFSAGLCSKLIEAIAPQYITSPEVISLLHSEVKYAGYISRYAGDIDKIKHYHKIKIPPQMSFTDIPSLSTEVKEKLEKHRPETLADALNIPGVTPAAIVHLQIHLSKTKMA